MAHYSQQYKGKPLRALTKQYRGLTPKVRFMKYVRVNMETGCWEWLGGKNDKGYGIFVLTMEGRTRPLLAHRAAWLLFHGPIPVDERHRYKTYGVLHHCDNKACVAPAHLFLGTQRDNALDAVRKHGHWGNGGQCGERCSWRKLSAEQVQDIWMSPLPERMLATQYGVSHGTIGDIKRRRSWRHVTEGLAVANTILTSRMAGILQGDPPMADTAPTPDFPRYGFSATEPGEPVKDSATGATVCNSRLFTSQAELDGAGGAAVWKATPAEAAQGAPPPARATTPTAEEDDDATPARRSHR